MGAGRLPRLPRLPRHRVTCAALALQALSSGGAVGCATSASVAGTEAPARPRPAGIAIDPSLELPRPAARAEPTAGIAVLEAPVDPEPARRVVRAFFDAVVAESAPALEALVWSTVNTRQNPRTRPEAALSSWRRRFDRLDYTALGGEIFYRRSYMEAETARDAAFARGRSLPAVPRGSEILVRVPIVGQAAEKLFGPELVFLLKKSQGPASTYKIAELFEDFRLP